MTGQYSLTEKEQKVILKILNNKKIDVEPRECLVDDDGKNPHFEDGSPAYHRSVCIKVCDYEDESEEFNMYVEVD